jgi:hypothetical protein
MNTSLKGLLAVVAIGLPSVAFAQSSDAQYCAALSASTSSIST